jgi:hypothetical protein
MLKDTGILGPGYRKTPFRKGWGLFNWDVNYAL